MSSLGFGFVAIVACLLCKDVESKMTNTVSALYKIICTIEMLTFCEIDVYLENDEYAHRNKIH